MSDLQPTLDHWRESWTAQLEDVTTYFPDTGAMTNPLFDEDPTAKIVLCVAFKSAQRLIPALEARIADLEKIIGVINEPVGRDVTAELGHVRGLDMLQWLNRTCEEDLRLDMVEGLAGIRPTAPLTSEEYTAVKALQARGLVGRNLKDCWITAPGRDYLAALKREVHGK